MMDGAPAPTPLSNIEAEQALLGAILVNNEVLNRLPAEFEAEQFYEPLHGRIFKTATKLVALGRLASPVTLKHYFEDDATMRDLGGPAYLARMAGAAIGISSAGDYAETVLDLARRRRLSEALLAGAQRVENMGEDARETAQALEAEIGDCVAGGARGQPRTLFMAEAANEAFEAIRQAWEGEKTVSVSTGLPSLDAEIGGLYCGDLILLGGRPGMGKSALAVSIAQRIASRSAPVLFVTREMTPRDIFYRVLSEVVTARGTPLEYSALRRFDIGEAEFRAMADASLAVQHWPLAIHDATDRRLSAVLSGVKRQLRRWRGLDLPPVVIVDYLQRVHADGSRYESVSDVSEAFKDLALAEDIPVVALAQLSREVEKREDKRPMMSDLRESGQLEQDADLIAFAYREEYYLERTKPKAGDPEALAEWGGRMDACRDRMEVIIAKQRAGREATLHLGFKAATNTFIDDEPQSDLEGFG